MGESLKRNFGSLGTPEQPTIARNFLSQLPAGLGAGAGAPTFSAGVGGALQGIEGQRRYQLEQEDQAAARSLQSQQLQRQIARDDIYEQNLISLMKNRGVETAASPTQIPGRDIPYAPEVFEQLQSLRGSQRAQIPGRDIPFSDDVISQKQQLATIGRTQDRDRYPVVIKTPTGEISGTLDRLTNTFTPAPEGAAGARTSPLPTGEITARTGLSNIDSLVTQVEELLTMPEATDSIGPIAGRVSSFQQTWLGGTAPEAVRVRQITENLSDQLLRARSGAQINEAEYRRLRALLPTTNLPLDTFKVRLQQFKSEMANVLSLRMQGGTLRRPVEGLGPGAGSRSMQQPTHRFNPVTGRIEAIGVQ